MLRADDNGGSSSRARTSGTKRSSDCLEAPVSTRSSKRATREGDSDRHPLSTSGRRPQAPSDALPGPAIMIGHPEAPVSFCAPGEIDILADERDTVVSSKRAQVASDLGFGADDDNDDDDDDATSAYDQPMSSSTLYRSTSTRSARSSSRTPEKAYSSASQSQTTVSTSTPSLTKRSAPPPVFPLDEPLHSTHSSSDTAIPPPLTTSTASTSTAAHTGSAAAEDEEPVEYSPLPTVPDMKRGAWARFSSAETDEISDVWTALSQRERDWIANPYLWAQHTELRAHMRVVLIDWLKEVSQEYGLHRETFYLAVNYVDRYLSSKRSTPKKCLQLLGISALFVAAKLEEIFPPKVQKFEYVTNQACSCAQIFITEMVLLKALKWNLTISTPVAWLHLFMQVNAFLDTAQPFRGSFHHAGRGSDDDDDDDDADTPAHTPSVYMFGTPNGSPLFRRILYDPTVFEEAMKIIDLAILDTLSMRFVSSVLAASAWFLAASHALLPDYSVVDIIAMTDPALHTIADKLPEVTGYSLAQLQPCLSFLATYDQFNRTHVRRAVPPQRPSKSGASRSHLIQTHYHGLTPADETPEETHAAQSACHLYSVESAFL